VTKLGRISFVLSQATTALCAFGAGFRYLHWRHSLRADAPVEARIFLGMCIVFSISFLVRMFRRGLVTKRDYFGEEMDHRRSLAKGIIR